MVNKSINSDFMKIIMAIVVAVVVALSGAGFASAQEDVGDIELSFEDDSYDGNITLYDTNDNVIAEVDVQDAPVMFEELEHGDYYLESVDNGSTVTSNNLSHEADTTLVEWDVPNNSLSVDQENQRIEYVAPTPENTADFVQNPSLAVLGGMILTGLTFFGIAGIIVIAGLGIVRRV